MFRNKSIKNIFRRKSSRTGTFVSDSPTSPLSPTSPVTNNTPRSFDPTGPKQPAQPTRRPNSSFQPPTMASSSEAPPAYSAPANPSAAAGTDSQFAFLSHFDTVFLIDDSGSMSGAKWRDTAAAISAIAPICTAHDSDGIDIHFLNTPDNSNFTHISSADAVNRVFSTVRPGGGTPTGMRLHQLLRPYLASLVKAIEKGKSVEDVKPLNIIVITDGEAGDDVESPIISAAGKLDKMDAPGWQIGIQFFQVGSDPEATRALQELDDGLGESGVRDIVDTVPWNGMQGGSGITADKVLKCVLGAVNRKLDRKKMSLEMLRR